jgi:aminoglycoside 3-N-acetyltransferase
LGAGMASSAIGDLANEWQQAGLGRGDTVLVHSSLRRTLRRLLSAGRQVTADDLLASFIEAVGPTGTLLMPLFNFDFPKGIRFDIRSSPSQMGALTEAARLHPRAVRTGHPIYSFAVIGAEAERYRGIENFSGYGADSPFAMLHRGGGRIAVLDLPDVQSMTFYHYVEQCNEVPYRFHKVFEGEYVGADGVVAVRRFGLFVRDTDKGVQTDVDPMGELLWKRGLYRGFRPGIGCGLRVIDAAAMFDAVSAIIRAGNAEGMLYRTEPMRQAG